MAFADPLVLAYGGSNYNCNRVPSANPNDGTTYYGLGTNIAITVKVKHTVPKVGEGGESHMFRVDIDHLDATTGAWKKSHSAWLAFRSDGLPQDATVAVDTAEAVIDFLTDANLLKLAERQS